MLRFQWKRPQVRGWDRSVPASSPSCHVAARHKNGGVPYVNQKSRSQVYGVPDVNLNRLSQVEGGFNLRINCWWT